MWEGENSYTYSDEDIAGYNNSFETEYYNSMTGIKTKYFIYLFPLRMQEGSLPALSRYYTVAAQQIFDVQKPYAPSFS